MVSKHSTSINEVETTISKSSGEWDNVRDSFRVETSLAISMPKKVYVTHIIRASVMYSLLRRERTFSVHHI